LLIEAGSIDYEIKTKTSNSKSRATVNGFARHTNSGLSANIHWQQIQPFHVENLYPLARLTHSHYFPTIPVPDTG
jgi:hypothetical protein